MTVLFITAILVLTGALWLLWACAAPWSTYFRPVFIRGPEQGKRIALTFDDGPTEKYTGQLLDILREHRVPATFFVCGKNVERYPAVLQRIVAEGHEVGNHTYSHPTMVFKSRQRIADEIERTQAIIEGAVGFRPHLFRPPYGARWFGLMPELANRGMRMILWSAAGYDWKKDAQGIKAAILRELKPGAVVLLHDGREARPAWEVDRAATVSALPRIIADAQRLGYKFSALRDLFPSA